MKANLIKNTLSALIFSCLSVFPLFSYAQTLQQDSRFAALAPWTSKGRVELIDVPAASNAISNMLLLASLKSGSESQAVERIVELLRAGSNPVVAVIGQKQSVTEATVLAALKKMGKPSGTLSDGITQIANSSTLIIVGNFEDEIALKEAAVAADIRLEIARIP